MSDKMQIFNNKKFYKKYDGYYKATGIGYMHRYVWSFYNGDIPNGFHIHHKDENRANNSIDNLELVEAHKHMSEHRKNWIKNNEEKFKKISCIAREKAINWSKSEAGRKWHSENSKRTNKIKREKKLLMINGGND